MRHVMMTADTEIILKSANMITSLTNHYHSTIKRERNLAKEQLCKCPVCDDSLYNGEEIHAHHIIPRKEGDKNTMRNLIILHSEYHNHFTYSQDKDYRHALFLGLKNR
uniref:Putative HNH endonuclease n=1 Tax=Hafniomonas laevis TaxID=436124 RepID=A0A0S2LP29_9CHLO|nr:putative HNH endonuclease [Hafniomonas laevis]ALO63091.1 putative HNH endonuclease [Hafniomonas laevis]